MTIPGARRRQVIDFGAAVLAAGDLDAVLEAARAAVTALRADARCSIRLIDEGAGGYRLMGAADAETPELLPVVPFGMGLTHAVAERRAPVLVQQLSTETALMAGECAVERTAGAYYGVPIAVGATLLGVLGVGFSALTVLTSSDQELIQFIARQAAVPIRNTRIQDELRQAHATLAEDLNNALTVIRGRAELLMLRTEDPDLLRGLCLIRDAALDGADTVGRVVVLARTARDTPFGRVEVQSRQSGPGAAHVSEELPRMKQGSSRPRVIALCPRTRRTAD
jgi:GAF domain-containing protein